MGRGNVCVTGECEGLFYIDRGDLDVWSKADGSGEEKLARELGYDGLTSGEWCFDQFRSDEVWDDAVESLIWKMHRKYPSFRECGKWLSNSRKAVMQNKLFYIAVEDNEWSMAVMLVQKDSCYVSLSAMQKRHYQFYLDSIRDFLFEQFDTLYIYAGPWTCGKIQKGEVA